MIMERKIGEIFEYNGEWYQCIEQPEKYDETVCAICAFQGNGNCELDRCSGTYRADKKSVIFKKLEKVGEPIIYMSRTFQKLKCPDTERCKYCYFGNQVCNPQLCGEESFLVEIKQTKEDMEEKKLNLKPFDIQKAREGKPVCTRDGRKVRIICFDGKGDQPIIALVEAKGNKDALIEKVERYFINGHSVFEVRETNNDLMMLPEKKDGWVNVYQGGKLDADYIYPTKADAVENISQPMKARYIDTIKVTWEEQP